MSHRSLPLVATLVLALVLLAPTSDARAQSPPTQGTVGLSASLQGEQTVVSLPIWVTSQATVAPAFGFVVVDNGTDVISLGADAHFYTRRARLSPYLGPRLQVQIRDPDRNNADTATDLLVGGVGGAEFFLATQFSLSVEGQLNLLFNDDRSDVFRTATAVRATVYF